MINRLLDGFEGKLTAGKWAKLTKVSTDTALRDITQLVTLGISDGTKAAGGVRATVSWSARKRSVPISLEATR